MYKFKPGHEQIRALSRGAVAGKPLLPTMVETVALASVEKSALRCGSFSITCSIDNRR